LHYLVFFVPVFDIGEEEEKKPAKIFPPKFVENVSKNLK